jgi:hypothetical protein
VGDIQKQVYYWGNNLIEFNGNVVLIYQEGIAVGCGCFKKQKVVL